MENSATQTERFAFSQLLTRFSKAWRLRLLIILLSSLISYLLALVLIPGGAARAALIGGITSCLVAIAVDHLVGRYRQIIRQQNQQLTRQNQELAALNGQLAENNAELRAFAYTVAHDIKTPLSAITLNAELLQHLASPELDGKLDQKARRIVQSGHHLLNIVDELLLLATLSQADVRQQSVDMMPIVARATGRLETLLQETGGTIHCQCDWPQVRAYGPWLEEVWVNYLSNGLKYGGPEPSLELGVTLLPDNRASFWVQDTGPGIATHMQDRLFAEFSRLSQERPDGHGLGLAIVQRIMTRLGGEAGVESRPGAGSRFYFILPLA